MKLKKLAIIILMIMAFLIVTNTNIFAKTVIVNTDTLKLRKEASTDSDLITLLDNGQKLEYIGEEGNWYKVKVNDNTGYVSKDYSKLEEENVEEPTPTPEEASNNEEPTEEEPVEAIPTEMKVKEDSKVYILPLINANTIQNIKKDSNVKIISKTNGWMYVETDEVMGWIRQSSLEDSSVVSDDKDTTKSDETDDTTKETADTEIKGDIKMVPQTMYINSSSVYVRKGPGTDYEAIDTLVLNDEVKAIGKNEDWYKVEVNNKTGYIAKRLLSDKQTETTTRSNNRENTQTTETVNQVTTSSVGTAKGQQIVDFAKQYLGKKYVYGASGPDTFDCSGFTMYIFKNFGVSLSHSATAQSRVGTPVAKSDLQPGDLVFFTDYETGVGIGHCGIYIGGGDFIHASSGTGYCVKISTLLSGSYYNRYETARRVI